MEGWGGRIRRRALVSDEIMDFTDQVVAALHSCNVPCSQEHGVIRIGGYMRPGMAPVFLMMQPHR